MLLESEDEQHGLPGQFVYYRHGQDGDLSRVVEIVKDEDE